MFLKTSELGWFSLGLEMVPRPNVIVAISESIPFYAVPCFPGELYSPSCATPSFLDEKGLSERTTVFSFLRRHRLKVKKDGNLSVQLFYFSH